MLSFGSGDARICVAGPTDFASEAGALAGAMAEALARSFPLAFLPTDGAVTDVMLPSGRVLPICRDPAAMLVSVWCDGPVAGIEPPGHLRYAWRSSLAEASPAADVAWLNAQVDAVLVPGAALVDGMRCAGVVRPVLHVPAPVDLDVPSLPPAQVVARLAGLIDPSIAAFRGIATDPAILRLTEARLGRRAEAIGGIRRQVCPAHDGDFLAVFNAYLSHLVWQQREDRCHAVLPDWDLGRLMGRPGDGNLWRRLFQPLFGATDIEMDDPRFLYRHAELPADRCTEPGLACDGAAALHRSPDFAAIRRQYHRVFTEHVRLRPDHQTEIDAFADARLTAPILIAAHVRRWRHDVEQPAGIALLVDQVRAVVRQRGGDPDGPGWTVFVATDQERVLHQFRAAFGDRAVFFAGEDVASGAPTPAGWNWRAAWATVRDAAAMARCHVLLHDVGDVSTAVSYMNPGIEMVAWER